MKKILCTMAGLCLATAVLAGTNPSRHGQVDEAGKHAKIAKHAVAQPGLSPDKAVDKKAAQAR